MRNKKKFISGFMAVLLLPFFVFSVAFGQDAPDRCSQSDEATNIRCAKMNGIASMMQAQIDRAQRAIDRLNQVIERVEARRAKMVGVTAKLTAVDAAIAQAKTDKAQAQAALDKAKTDLETFKTSTASPKPAAQAFMASMRTLKKELIELHRSLKTVLREMRKAVPKEKDNEQEPAPTNN
jgi:ABC-type transporter Mla subunit MlaD